MKRKSDEEFVFIGEVTYNKEDDMILPPGPHLRMIDQIEPAKDLTIIH